MIVAGTASTFQIISVLVAQLDLFLAQCMETEQQIPDLVEAHHLSAIIHSMPRVGVGTSPRILTEAVGKDFKNASHLDSYSEIASVNRKPGTSIKCSHASQRGSKILKRVLFSYLLLLR